MGHSTATYSTTNGDEQLWEAVCSCGWSAGQYTLAKVAELVAEGHRINANQATPW